MVKIDANGNLLWEKTFGGSYSDQATSVQQTADGGYIVAGGTGFRRKGAQGTRGVYLVKTDINGNLLWEKTFGGNYYGYNKDIYLVKTNVNGDPLWEKTLGGNEGERGASVQQTADGCYIIVGETSSYGARYNKDI